MQADCNQVEPELKLDSKLQVIAVEQPLFSAMTGSFINWRSSLKLHGSRLSCLYPLLQFSGRTRRITSDDALRDSDEVVTA